MKRTFGQYSGGSIGNDKNKEFKKENQIPAATRTGQVLESVYPTTTLDYGGAWTATPVLDGGKF